MFERIITLPPPGVETFFLWGARQTGKTTLLHQRYPDALWIDLLRSEVYRRLLDRPERLREEVAAWGGPPFVVIDEVQKLPVLLDEVHLLHEREGIRFALSGSSARKVRRGHANLLGGRAIRYELHGFVSRELGDTWDLDTMLNRGWLPGIVAARRPKKLLESYVATYLKEEIAAEGLVRRLPTYSRFLEAAALSDGELVNYSTIARDTGVSSMTVRSYFEILEDTLLGRWLPSYVKRPKRRVIRAPKFYFGDVGVVNLLARRGHLSPGTPLYGKAFESWIHHELVTHGAYRDSYDLLSYWRLASGIEVDFIIDDVRVAIEAKATERVTSDHCKGLRHLVQDHPQVERRIIVCLEDVPRRTEDGIDILPAREFAKRLWDGVLL